MPNISANNINISININVVITIASIVITAGFLIFLLSFPKCKLFLNETITKPLSWIFKRFRSTYLAFKLSGKLESFSKNLLIPSLKKKKIKVQVKFIELINQSIPENEKIFMFSSSEKKYEENITKATMQFVDETLVPKYKQTFNRDFKEGIRLTLTRKIFSDNNEKSALEYLMTEVVPDEYDKYPKLESRMKELVRTDDYGLFASILMHQYVRLNSIFIDTVDFSELKEEVEKFKDYILAFTNRPRKQHVKLRFNGKYFKTLIVLVGSARKLSEYPDGSHYSHVISSDQTSDIIYVIAPAIAQNPDSSAVTSLSLKIHPKVVQKIKEAGGFKLISNQTIPLPSSGIKIQIATFIRSSLNRKNEAL